MHFTQNILKTELISQIVFEEIRAVKHVFWSNRNIGLLIILKLKIIILHHHPAAWELSQLSGYISNYLNYFKRSKRFLGMFLESYQTCCWWSLGLASYTWSSGSLKNSIFYLCLATCEWLWLLIRIFNSFLFNIFIASEMQVAWPQPNKELWDSSFKMICPHLIICIVQCFNWRFWSWKKLKCLTFYWDISFSA